MNQTDLNILKNKKWHFTYDRKMSYQRIHLFNFGYCNQYSKFFGVDINSEIYRIKDEHVSVYFELNDHKKAFEVIRDKFFTKKSVTLIKKINKIIVADYKKFISFSKQQSTNYLNFSNKKILSAFKGFYRQNEKIALANWLLYLYIEEILTEAVRFNLNQKIHDANLVEEIMTNISKPTTMLPIDTYHLDLYKIALLPKTDQESAVKKLTQKYISWGVFDVTYDVPTTDLHVKKLSEIFPKDAKQKIQEINDKYKEQKTKNKNLSKFWKNDPVLNAFVELYTLYANFKDWKNYYREFNSYKFKLLIEEVSHRFGRSVSEIAFLNVKEMTSLLTQKDFDFSNVTKIVSDGAIVYLNGKEIFVDQEVDLSAIDHELLLKEEVLEIKGMVAFAGIVRGIVKVVTNIADLSEINASNILVSSTTRPDYLAYMQKSAGFITNEGGMLSHAAIMARELKKPCIIGTKIATKVLKDGDLVEVDANKGVVTILNKKNDK